MSVHQTTDGRWFVRYPKGKIAEDPERTREYFGKGPEAELKARDTKAGIGSDQANIKISQDKPLKNGTLWCLKATFQGQRQHSIQKMHWINQ